MTILYEIPSHQVRKIIQTSEIKRDWADQSDLLKDQHVRRDWSIDLATISIALNCILWVAFIAHVIYGK